MTWQNKLIKKKCFDSPVVEHTPVVWKGKLLLVETWQTHWEGAPMTQRKYYVRIRDEQSPQGRADDGTPWRYRLTCTDGPVFDAAEVVW